MFRQSELTARAAQTIDDLDGHHVRRTAAVFARRHVPLDDLVQMEQAPQLPGQPDIPEATGMGPAHLLEANANDVGVVGQVDLVVVRK